MASLLLLPLAALSQQVKIPQNADRFTYWQFEYGEKTDTTVITVDRYGDVIIINTPKPEGTLIPGYCQTVTSVDYAADSITMTATYDDSAYYYRTGFSRSDLEWKREGNHWTTSVNSNTLVFEMDEKEISHIQLPVQQEKARRLGILTFFVGLFAKRPSTMGAGLLSTVKSVSTSEFDKVRHVRSRRWLHTIKVNQLLDRNQVYVPDEDYDFVYDFIKNHCPNLK